MIADLDGYFGPDRIAATLDELRQVYDQVLLQLPQKWLDSRSVIDGNKVSTRARSPSTGDLAASALFAEEGIDVDVVDLGRA
jgi:hypothetical protein